VFDHLIESRKQRSWRTMLGNSAASVVFHVIMIIVAVYATLHAGENIVERIQTVAVTLQTEQKKEEPPPPEDQPATVEPPPKGFQTLSIPTTIPVDIPPPTQSSFNAADFSGVGVEGGVARGVEGGTGPVISDQPYLEAVVEERPETMAGTCQLPQYPPILQQAGVEGRVLAEFVIDTAGRAEPASLRIVQSTNRAFEPSAREVVLKSIYRPGRMHGEPVRVLVQVPVTFSIRKPVA